jgi:hypothetical protein
MPDNFLLFYALPWAQFSVSLFNTILLLWLGLTVFLNAQNRSWGTYLASGGLLLGGTFFLAHSAALDSSIEGLLPCSACLLAGSF